MHLGPVDWRIVYPYEHCRLLQVSFGLQQSSAQEDILSIGTRLAWIQTIASSLASSTLVALALTLDKTRYLIEIVDELLGLSSSGSDSPMMVGTSWGFVATVERGVVIGTEDDGGSPYMPNAM